MSKIRKKLAGKTTKLADLHERLGDRPSALNDYPEGGFYHIDIELIKPNPDQPRKYFDPAALDELEDSIRQRGVLQPLIVRKETDAIYLVAGERRLRAAKRAGLERVPAILTRGNPVEISLIENLQRENLTPMEEAEALLQMTGQYGYTQQQLAMALGKARSTIAETLALNRLPEQIKEACRRADIPRRVLIEIAKQKNEREMIALFRRVRKANLTSDQVRSITRGAVGRRARSIRTRILSHSRALFRLLEGLRLDEMDEGERALFARELKKTAVRIQELLRQR